MEKYYTEPCKKCNGTKLTFYSVSNFYPKKGKYSMIEGVRCSHCLKWDCEIEDFYKEPTKLEVVRLWNEQNVTMYDFISAEEKVKRAILSCKNTDQLKSAVILTENFERKYSEYPATESTMVCFEIMMEEKRKLFR